MKLIPYLTWNLPNCIHIHKKWKDSLEARAVLLIFLFEREISGVAEQRLYQNTKKWWLCEEFLSQNDFKTVLTTFCCHGYGVNASGTVQMIAADQKDYHKCSLYVIICWIAKIYESIIVKKGWLLTRTPPA